MLFDTSVTTKLNTMKTHYLLIGLLLAVSATALAQENGNETDRTGMEWILDEAERVQFDPQVQGPIITYDYDDWMPFNDMVAYSIYGSQYRKAKSRISWGGLLALNCFPLAAVTTVYAFSVSGDGSQELAAAAVSLALLYGGYKGVKLWKKGRREMDWMLDDYARRYGPKPHSASLSVGPTENGVGLAFNF